MGLSSEYIETLIKEAENYRKYPKYDSRRPNGDSLIERLVEALQAVKQYADHGPPGQ